MEEQVFGISILDEEETSFTIDRYTYPFTGRIVFACFHDSHYVDEFDTFEEAYLMFENEYAKIVFFKMILSSHFLMGWFVETRKSVAGEPLKAASQSRNKCYFCTGFGSGSYREYPPVA